MEKYNLKNKTDIKMHNVLFATTTEKDYEMGRLLLLEKMPDTKYDEFVLVEGYHCSCYDFDETNWDCIKLTRDELNKLLENVNDWEIMRKELKEFLLRYWKGVIYSETADEMLKSLGYEEISDDKYSIEYRKILDGDLFEINFWKEDKTISKNYYRDTGYITLQELQAIDKKVEELGWI